MKYLIITILIFFSFENQLKWQDYNFLAEVNRQEVNAPGKTTIISPQEKNELSIELNKRYLAYKEWETRFKYAYFTCLVLSLLASAASGLLIKLDAFKGKKHITDWVAILAAVAALLQVLNTSVGLNSRYIANRNARSAIQELQIKMKSGFVSKKEVWDEILEIHKKQSKLE